MIKVLKGAAIGLLVAGGLGFAVATAVFSHWDYGYVSEYPWMGGVVYGVLGALVGGMIGGIVGAVVDWRERK